MQQRPGLYLPNKKRQHLIEINHTSKSMDDQSCPLQIQISCDDDIADPVAAASNSLAKSKVQPQKQPLASADTAQSTFDSEDSMAPVGGVTGTTTNVTSNPHHQPQSFTASGLASHKLADCRPARSYDRDIGECSQGLNKVRHGQSILALHKVSTGSSSVRSFSPDVSYLSESSAHLPNTKRFLTKANRHLAASTLRLWQTGSGGGPASVMASAAVMRPLNKRKTRSFYNLQEFI